MQRGRDGGTRKIYNRNIVSKSISPICRKITTLGGNTLKRELARFVTIAEKPPIFEGRGSKTLGLRFKRRAEILVGDLFILHSRRIHYLSIRRRERGWGGDYRGV